MHYLYLTKVPAINDSVVYNNYDHLFVGVTSLGKGAFAVSFSTL